MARKEEYSVGVLHIEKVAILPTYTVATVPAAATYPRGMIYVSNGAAGSPCMAISNGTNWLRCDTLAAIAAS